MKRNILEVIEQFSQDVQNLEIVYGLQVVVDTKNHRPLYKIDGVIYDEHGTRWELY